MGEYIDIIRFKLKKMLLGLCEITKRISRARFATRERERERERKNGVPSKCESLHVCAEKLTYFQIKQIAEMMTRREIWFKKKLCNYAEDQCKERLYLLVSNPLKPKLV
jgi:hypothetical protein